jgi:hypothetical protein
MNPNHDFFDDEAILVVRSFMNTRPAALVDGRL